jgi:four helix bundle protein
MSPFERLHAWRHAHDLFLAIHRTSEGWPRREWYGLTSQVRRSAFSVAANIAEGSAKRGPKEFRRFLDMALGSLAETQYALRAALDLGYLTETQSQSLEGKAQEAGKTLWGLARSLDPRS